MPERRSQLGLGVMIQMLGGYHREDIEAAQAAIGKKIASMKKVSDGDGAIDIRFTDGTGIRVADHGRSCCESRYLEVNDADLQYHVGAKLRDIEVAKTEEKEAKWGDVKEIAFLHIKTSRGVIVANTYNEHNGYYGGFSIQVTRIPE